MIGHIICAHIHSVEYLVPASKKIENVWLIEFLKSLLEHIQTQFIHKNTKHTNRLISKLKITLLSLGEYYNLAIYHRSPIRLNLQFERLCIPTNLL